MNNKTHSAECVISKRDLELLLRGAESEKEVGYRNLFAGVAGSCGLGLMSTVVPRFGEFAATGFDPLGAALLILLTAVTLASSVLALFFHRRVQLAGARGDFQTLGRTIRAQLDQPLRPEDPRHWP